MNRVDLVGHDWGALLTYRLATTYDGPVRTWAAHVASIMHRDCVWHDFAQIWQTPGKGEDYFRTVVDAGPGLSASAFESMGVPPTEAMRMAGWIDQRMAQSVLDLYRSATPNPFADWGATIGPARAPGLVLHPSQDMFSHGAMSREVAAMLGADYRELVGRPLVAAAGSGSSGAGSRRALEQRSLVARRRRFSSPPRERAGRVRSGPEPTPTSFPTARRAPRLGATSGGVGPTVINRV